MNQATLIERLERIVGPGGVFHRPADLLVYEYDGSVEGAVDTARPAAVVLPTTTEQVAAIVRLADEAGLPVIARGAGTGLSGGAVAQQGGIIVALDPDGPHPGGRPRGPDGAGRAGRRSTSSSPRRRCPAATSSRPTPPASAPARSAATSPRTPAGRTASSTASPPTTSSGWRSCCRTGESSGSAAAPRAAPATT